MAKNQRYTHNRHIALPADKAVESGAPVKIGQYVGVAQTKAAVGEKVTVWLDGSYDVPVTGAVTEGGIVYIKTTHFPSLVTKSEKIGRRSDVTACAAASRPCST